MYDARAKYVFHELMLPFGNKVVAAQYALQFQSLTSYSKFSRENYLSRRSFNQNKYLKTILSPSQSYASRVFPSGIFTFRRQKKQQCSCMRQELPHRQPEHAVKRRVDYSNIKAIYVGRRVDISQFDVRKPQAILSLGTRRTSVQVEIRKDEQGSIWQTVFVPSVQPQKLQLEMQTSAAPTYEICSIDCHEQSSPNLFIYPLRSLTEEQQSIQGIYLGTKFSIFISCILQFISYRNFSSKSLRFNYFNQLKKKNKNKKCLFLVCAEIYSLI